MRFYEIASIQSPERQAAKRKRVVDANHRTSVAAKKYQDKLTKIKASELKATNLPAGPQRTQRIDAATQGRRDAANVYQNVLKAAAKNSRT